MTNTPFKDSVAIDTNVFIHLLNPCKNTDSHISALLRYLQIQAVALIVDDGNRISNEYETRIIPAIKTSDERDNERYLLNYWFGQWNNAERHVVVVNRRDRLMVAIEKVISGRKQVDRTFVYVAFKIGKVLISNDEKDIVRGPTRKRKLPSRRRRLLRKTKKLRPDGADIITSEKAHAKCPKQP